MINNIEVATAAGYTRISADIAGESVWFRLPDQHFHGNIADALSCLAFFPAMARHAHQPPGQLELPEPYQVSPRLLDSLPLLQDIFRAWCPPLQPFTHNLATHQTPTPVSDQTTAQVGASFSGGVDSHYTMLRHASDISCLVHIDGFEFEPGNEASAQTIAALAEQAARYNKPLIVVETNALAFYRAFKLQRYLIFGAFLASVAHLLGLRKFLIPSSYAFDELVPGGSHALTDPLWSSEGVQLIHDAGIHHRLGKMRFLAEHSDALDHILVCWHDHVENCG
ncbi:MAG: hypothetical protein AAF993_01875 [Pseudomonadota bacterium]